MQDLERQERQFLTDTHRGIRDALAPATDVVRSYCERSGPSMELELRFGTLSNGLASSTFTPGVPQRFFDSACRLLDACDLWTRVSDWEEHWDYHFRDCHSQAVRSRSTPGKTPNVTNVYKRTWNTCDFRPLDFNDPTLGAGVCPLDSDTRVLVANAPRAQDCPDIRFQLSDEEPVPPSNLPELTAPTFVRIKQRRSYWYKSAFDEPCWRYDVSRIWQGPNRAAAELAQRNLSKPPIFDIEIELLNGSGYVQQYHPNKPYVTACSFLLKALDFMPHPCMLVPVKATSR